MKTHPFAASVTAVVARIDPHWAWHHRTLLRLRENLLQAQTEHEKAAAAPSESRGCDRGDAAQEEIEHEVILAELHVEVDRLAEIDAALQRLSDGTYGICGETGKSIPAQRLRAIPWTRYSHSAAERSEQTAQ